MKKSILSIATAFLAFATLQTANAQKSADQAEAGQLYQTVMDSKAELDELVKKGVVVHEAKSGNSSDAIMHDAKGGDPNDIIIIDMNKILEQVQDFNSRVEETGGKMTAAQLAAFKAELAKIDTQLAQLESKQTQNLTGTALQNCWNACKSVWPKWWHTVNRVACYAGCLLL
ncbi:MAG: hypothetical protein ACK4Q5_09985 [Saprospiraceae bacterium]